MFFAAHSLPKPDSRFIIEGYEPAYLRLLRSGELARRGLLLRHLVMPGKADEASAIFQWLAQEISEDSYVNIMGQYRPVPLVNDTGSKGKYKDIDRRPSSEEIRAAYMAAREAGLWRFDERS